MLENPYLIKLSKHSNNLIPTKKKSQSIDSTDKDKVDHQTN